MPNVGLMAQQAEEYGSHDKTFEIPEDGVANIVDLATGEVLLTPERGSRRHLAHVPGQGRPIRDWVKLAVNRARNSGMPVVFWLDPVPSARERADQEGQDVPARARHHRPRHPDHEPGARCATRWSA